MFHFNYRGLLSFGNDRSDHKLSEIICFYRVVNICFEARDILKPILSVSKCKFKPLPRLTLICSSSLNNTYMADGLLDITIFKQTIE